MPFVILLKIVAIFFVWLLNLEGAEIFLVDVYFGMSSGDGW